MPTVVCTKSIVVNIKLHDFVLIEMMFRDTHYMRKNWMKEESHEISILSPGYSDNKSAKHFYI